MARSNRQSTFIRLREQFPFFTFEKQEYTLSASGLDIRFTFNLADRHKFQPLLFVPRKSFFLTDEKIANSLDNIVFNIGMIELISYWKAACPPKLIIRPFSLSPEQQAWWKKIYFHGLGEFFFLNSIDVTEQNFMQMFFVETHNCASLQETHDRAPMRETHNCASLQETRDRAPMRETHNCASLQETRDRAPIRETHNCASLQETRDRAPIRETHNCASLRDMHDRVSIPETNVIIPVGGGKDSAVTLELLGRQYRNIPLIINPRGASLATVVEKGFSVDQVFEIKRTIDPELLRLNDLGFLNGHTPFSAMLAFVTVLAAMVTGIRHIALSNESSANEPTIEGTNINHQYSKSFQFESDFREYVKRWICGDINYFSFLRPLNELQIASLFSQFQQYHPVFKSCNAGSKTNSWCGVCAKCLFTYIILSPFIDEFRLVEIFGKNLFSDGSLKPLFDQLTGAADEKPFDCVGTIREVNLALCETIRQRQKSGLPYLLNYYRNSKTFAEYGPVGFAGELSHISSEHYLLPEFLEILQVSANDNLSSIYDKFDPGTI